MPVLRYLPFLTFLKNIVSLTCLELAALDNVGWPEIPGIYLSTFPTLASKEGDNMPMPCFYLFIFLDGFLGSDWHPLLPGQSF